MQRMGGLARGLAGAGGTFVFHKVDHFLFPHLVQRGGGVIAGFCRNLVPQASHIRLHANQCQQGIKQQVIVAAAFLKPGRQQGQNGVDIAQTLRGFIFLTGGEVFQV